MRRHRTTLCISAAMLLGLIGGGYGVFSPYLAKAAPNVRLAAQPAAQEKPRIGFEGDINMSDGIQVAPGQEILKLWLAHSNFDTKGYHLNRIGDEPVGYPGYVSVPEAREGQLVVCVLKDCKAPTTPGRYKWEYGNRNFTPLRLVLVVNPMLKKVPVSTFFESVALEKN